MRVAVPLFGQDVAPRFGFTDRFVIAEIDEERVVSVETVTVDLEGWPSRLGQLRKLGVETILCGGFNRFFVPLAEVLGISIVAGFCGDARQTIDAFARGEASPTFFCSGLGGSGVVCQRRRRRRRGKGRNKQSE